MTGIQFICASGASLFECSFLAMRYDAGFDADLDAMESWVMERAGVQLIPQVQRAGWLVDLWRGPSGACFAADVGGTILHRRSGDVTAPWHEMDLPCTLHGVFGVREDNVFAWGERGHDGLVFRYDGSLWSELQIPGTPRALHGVADDLVFAVGDDGMILRWDGLRWQTMAPPAGVRLRSVFVVDDDEVYALAKHQVFAGSVYGWTELCAVEENLHAVAKYDGVVYVGAGDEGLFRLDGDRLEPVDTTVPAGVFDVRGQFLVTGAHSVLTRNDEGEFVGFSDEAFANITRDRDPLWQP